ncbi:MAG: DUF3253 domain-containing protein [Rhizobiales bacterium]|nr:DUF3253 domain-containing protein [Hyphomicrobiales bacterium]
MYPPIRDSPVTIGPNDLDATILALLAERPAGRTIAPEEIARAVAADTDWRTHFAAVRRAAVKLALDGRLVIYRKGKPVDPGDFKGVYRLGLPHLD